MKRNLILAVVTLFGLGVVTWIAALSFASATERQVTYRYFAEALTPLAAKHSLVKWEPNQTPLVRPVLAGDQDRVGQTLTDAWQALAVAQSSGRVDILDDAFSGVALSRARISVDDAQAHGGRMAVLSQTVTPTFFHLDGSSMQAKADMVVARYIESDDGLVTYRIDRDAGLVTLMNETLGWRVYSYERRNSAPVEDTAAIWSSETLRGINYYPSETPWRSFWPNFDAKQTREDFDRVTELGANAIRIFLSRDDFIDPVASKTTLDDLQTLLAIAGEKGLRVVPTLFDLRHTFGPGTWAADAGYLERVLPILNASGVVSFVDLKNEPDLDFEAHGRAEVEAWLRTMITMSRQIAPDLSLSVGWSSAEAAPILADRLDVVTYHEYGDADGVADRLRRVQDGVDGKPVLVTEIGASSFEVAFGFPGSLASQADIVTTRMSDLDGADGVFLWALYDFTALDADAIGASPWMQRLQSSYGLFDTDGQIKPAGIAARSIFLQGR